MIKDLKMTHVGPAPAFQLEFGKRLNLLTGDNGLGKSFLLDTVWWALTRKWPAEINSKLPAGLMARPRNGEKATIEFSFDTPLKTVSYSSSFDRKLQSWTGKAGRPPNPGLVLYAMVDGSFAVWDPARNYWRKKGNLDVQDRPPAYVFSSKEIWHGLDGDRGRFCNGLLEDWARWQLENGDAFKMLKKVLAKLSPSPDEQIIPGELTRIGIDDIADIPTLIMNYGQSVPVLHASSGIRRIIALAYLLVWSWTEHCRASEILGQETTSQIVFLVDEIEAHLHPKWQRQIIGALLGVMGVMTRTPAIQVIITTHSPLVMSSVEPLFKASEDAWFDIDSEGNEVALRRREFAKHGEAGLWLVSEEFGLKSGRASEYESLLDEAAALLDEEPPDVSKIEAMYRELVKALNPKDDFLFRWRSICFKRGFLK